jgi:hypothetical protein
MSMRVFITHNVPGAQWQLGSPSPEKAAFALIGWNSDELEGGVPEPIITVLAMTLSAFGRVTFACSTISAADAQGWQMLGSDFVIGYRTRSVLGRIAARFSAAPADLVLLSTTAERSVRRLFDDTGYPWWSQDQFALLSSAGASSPDFDRIAFDPATLFEAEWSECLGRLLPLGVQAILRPGVDGDVAGLLCASNEVRNRFESILCGAAKQFGMSLEYVSEAEFVEALASSPPAVPQ